MLVVSEWDSSVVKQRLHKRVTQVYLNQPVLLSPASKASREVANFFIKIIQEFYTCTGKGNNYSQRHEPMLYEALVAIAGLFLKIYLCKYEKDQINHFNCKSNRANAVGSSLSKQGGSKRFLQNSQIMESFFFFFFFFF